MIITIGVFSLDTCCMIGLSAGLTVPQKDNLLFSQLFSRSEFSSKANPIKVRFKKAQTRRWGIRLMFGYNVKTRKKKYCVQSELPEF